MDKSDTQTQAPSSRWLAVLKKEEQRKELAKLQKKFSMQDLESSDDEDI